MKARPTSSLEQSLQDRRGSKGQAMTEYIILVAVVAMLMIGAVRGFSSALEDLFQSAQARLAENPEGSRGGRNYVGPDRSFEETNPYEWNSEAERWYDPETRLFVSFDEVSNYEEDPYRYLRRTNTGWRSWR